MSLDTLKYNGSEWKARATEAAGHVSERGREVLQSPEAQRIAREIGGAAMNGALDQVSKRGKDGERKLSVIKTARALTRPHETAGRVVLGAVEGARSETKNQIHAAKRKVISNGIDYGMDQFRSSSTPAAIESTPDYSYAPSSSYEADPFGNSTEAAPSPDRGTPSTDYWESTPATQSSSSSVESSPDRSFSLRDRFKRKQEAAPVYASEETDDWGDKIVRAPAAPVAPTYSQESSKRGFFKRKQETYTPPVSNEPSPYDYGDGF